MALVSGAAALLLSAPAQAANPQHAGLQVALRAWGLYTGPIDGIIGPQTRDALKKFQKKKGLPADGVAGTRTRLALDFAWRRMVMAGLRIGKATRPGSPSERRTPVASSSLAPIT